MLNDSRKQNMVRKNSLDIDYLWPAIISLGYIRWKSIVQLLSFMTYDLADVLF